MDDRRLLSELPAHIRTEVSLVMSRDLLAKVPIFAQASEGFIYSLVRLLKPQV